MPKQNDKPTWTKSIPSEEGWWWMQYQGKNGLVTCPASVVFVGDYVSVRSARGDAFTAGPNHGGPQLRHQGRIDRTIRFGPAIEEPV